MTYSWPDQTREWRRRLEAKRQALIEIRNRTDSEIKDVEHQLRVIFGEGQ